MVEQKNRVIDDLILLLMNRGHLKIGDAEALKTDFANHEAQYFEDFLLEEGLIEKDVLLNILQEYYGVRAVDVLGEMFDHGLLTMFPKDVLLRNCCIPYYREGNILFVITNDPNNDERVEILHKFASYDIEFFVGIPRHIDMMIKDFYQDELYESDFDDTIVHAEREDDEYRLYPEEENEYKIHRGNDLDEDREP